MPISGQKLGSHTRRVSYSHHNSKSMARAQLCSSITQHTSQAHQLKHSNSKLMATATA